jgi:type I restriction enzyme R subunit
MEQGRRDYLGIVAGLSGDKAVEAVLEHFRDPDGRDKFYRYFRELEEVYEILSPDEFLRPFLDDYRALSELYQVLRSSYEARPIASLDFLKKTASLVQEHTHGFLVREPPAVYGIDVETLGRLAQEDAPDAVKVFNLLKAIRQIVEAQAGEQPYLISIGERAEAVVRAFEERQLTTQETLRQLVEGPVRELQEAEEIRKRTNLSPEAFAIFWMLNREGVAASQEAAQQVIDALGRHPYWRTSEQHEREARKEIYKALLLTGVGDPVSVADRLLQVLRESH